MRPAGPGTAPVMPSHRRPGSGYLLVILVSVALGIVGIVPFVMVAYSVEQLALAPLGLAPRDPTNNDGVAVVVIVGVVAPLAVAAGWALLVAAVARRHILGSGCWVVAAACLMAPTLVHVVGPLG